MTLSSPTTGEDSEHGCSVWGPYDGAAGAVRKGLAGELARLGFTDVSARCQLGLAAHLSRWLAGAGLGAAALTVPVAEEYLAARRAAGYKAYLTPKALAPLLGYLRGLGVAGEGEAQRRRHRPRCCGGVPLLPAGRAWRAGRGGPRLPFRPPVRGAPGRGGAGRGRLSAGDVTAFLTGESRRLAPKTAQRLATALRSLLRFWHLQGLISGPLDRAVPRSPTGGRGFRGR